MGDEGENVKRGKANTGLPRELPRFETGCPGATEKPREYQEYPSCAAAPKVPGRECPE